MRNVLLVISAQSHFQKLCIKYLFSKSQWLETGEKHFACDQCPKSFLKELHEISISSQSRSGQKLATGEKRFSCDHCPKSFSKELYKISISFQSHNGEKLVSN